MSRDFQLQRGDWIMQSDVSGIMMYLQFVQCGNLFKALYRFIAKDLACTFNRNGTERVAESTQTAVGARVSTRQALGVRRTGSTMPNATRNQMVTTLGLQRQARGSRRKWTAQRKPSGSKEHWGSHRNIATRSGGKGRRTELGHTRDSQEVGSLGVKLVLWYPGHGPGPKMGRQAAVGLGWTRLRAASTQKTAQAELMPLPETDKEF